MMKPKGQNLNDDGMLEFLEDIIGSNRFKQPIEVLAKRVETLNEMRGEKVSVTPNEPLVGSIYGRSSIKIANFVSIHLQRWPPQAILVFDWLISKKNSPLKLLSQMK